MENIEILKQLSKPYNTYDKNAQSVTRNNFEESVALGKLIVVDRLKKKEKQNKDYDDYEIYQMKTTSGNQPVAIKKGEENIILTDGYNKYNVEDLLWPLVSTITINLEPNGWGTRFPILLNDLCSKGKVTYNKLTYFLYEIFSIRKHFKKLKIKDIYLDYDNKNKKVKCNKEEDYEDGIINFFSSHLPEDNILIELMESAIEALIMESDIELRRF